MDVFVHKFISVTPKKILGKNCSEISFAGTNLNIPFLPEEENSNLDSKYSISIKDLRSEIDSVKKTSKTIIIKNGEPCLQGLALKTLADYIKKNDFFLAIETYGTRPNIIKHLIDHKLVDIVILKIYFPLLTSWFNRINKEKLISNHNEIIENIRKTIEILKKAKINVRVKTIIVPSIIYRKEDVIKIAREIKDIRNCNYEIVAFEPDKVKKSLKDIKKPTEDFLEELRQHLRKEYPLLNIR
jgi:pyruvate formate lyase activating enzyme